MKRCAGAFALFCIVVVAGAMGTTAAHEPVSEWPLMLWMIVVFDFVGYAGLFVWANWPRPHPDDGYTGEEASDGQPE